MTEQFPVAGDVQAYIAGPCQRLNDGNRILFVQVSIGEWRPKVGGCHNNVTDLGRVGYHSISGRAGLGDPVSCWQRIRLTAHLSRETPTAACSTSRRSERELWGA